MINGIRAAKGAALAAAGAVLGWAPLFLVLNLAGPNRCGAGACPSGSDAANGLTLAFFFLGLFGTLGAVAWAAGEPWRRRRILGIAGCGLLLGLAPGWFWHESLHGPRLDAVWAAPPDRPSDVRGVGNWGVGTTLVRARPDGLTAYNTRDGQERWTFAAPPRQSVCAMSSRTAGGTGLVGFAAHGKPCAAVALVDLSTGRQRWRQPVAGDGRFTEPTDDRIALADGTAVVAEDTAVRGLKSADGGRSWRRTLDRGCQALSVDASAARVLLVEQCGTRDSVRMRLGSLDARTGEPRWSARLPVASRWEQLYVLSAEPAVIALRESDKRGTAAVLSFDDKGRRRAAVPLSGRREDVMLRAGTYDFAARPALAATIVDDVLVTAVRRPADHDVHRLAAYSLADGTTRWDRSFKDAVAALTRRPDGGLAVLTRSGSDGTVHRLDPRTGAASGEPEPVGGEDELVEIWTSELYHDGHGYTVVNRDGTDDNPPAFGARPR
ncbi:PQQ-binding-like beta-propeller repeat protein [Streptomyces sp. AV19]|uniref:outer membrane protein assembly factor BamB family protein n=1 Tax=Streptomyces sp. AV19 TaxID=2793068 RepID=UPI0018FEC081|nr:PQQ-binding-like beta-propeller repeat protein [Streptomyces sp. AV19]MBH1933348.1 PQQ-binding-like beta-propeller repeat protein [Streptomyces sp. AV19]MDG4531959.1 PQQ-like beta-propeller repeat protein [Streptomyces sp. AV19]